MSELSEEFSRTHLATHGDPSDVLRDMPISRAPLQQAKMNALDLALETGSGQTHFFVCGYKFLVLFPLCSKTE